MRNLATFTFTVFFAQASYANPVCDVSRTTAEQDLKQDLLERYSTSYSTVEMLLDSGMDAYDTLCQLPDSTVTNEILADLNSRYYPSFYTILTLYEANIASYEELNIDTPSTDSGGSGGATTGSGTIGNSNSGYLSNTVETNPAAKTFAPINIQRESTTLMAEVNPLGWSTTIYFEYGEFDADEFDYENSIYYGNLKPSMEDITISRTVAGLACGTKYYYRARATNIFGTTYGDTKSFNTHRCTDSELIGNLESPKNGSYKSGVGTLRGWVCNAGNITVSFDNGPEVPIVYGNRRGDTENICGDKDNGFELLYNWNILGNGEHTAVVYVEGVELASRRFTVTTLDENEPFLRDRIGNYELHDFPSQGQSTIITWSEQDQNFVITHVSK